MYKIVIIEDDSDSDIPAEKLLSDAGCRVIGAELSDTHGGLENIIGRYNHLVENSSELISELDEAGRFIYLNEKHRKVLGYESEELLGTPAADLLHPDDLNKAVTKHSDLKQAAGSSVDVWRFRHRNGHYLTFECHGSVLCNNRGEKSTIVVSHDISERIKAERQKDESEARFAAFMNHLPGAVFLKDESDTVLYCNALYASMLNATPEEIIGTRRDSEVPEELRIQYGSENRLVLEKGEIVVAESTFVHEEETSHWLTYKFPVQVADSLLLGAVSIDITAQKKTEEKLKVALNDKEQLMQELNHRVKNNLLLVSSLLSLKEHEKGVDFSDIRQQIATIRMVHEKLYQREGLKNIALTDYIDNLLANLQQINVATSIILERHIEDISLDADKAIPLGLIINELITNAVKHGYNGTDQLTIKVILERIDGERGVRLTVSNDGRPFPEELVIGESERLGLKLVKALVGQLAGTFRIHSEPITAFVIEFSSDPA